MSYKKMNLFHTKYLPSLLFGSPDTDCSQPGNSACAWHSEAQNAKSPVVGIEFRIDTTLAFTGDFWLLLW